jgi:hypothetical protein
MRFLLRFSKNDLRLAKTSANRHTCSKSLKSVVMQMSTACRSAPNVSLYFSSHHFSAFLPLFTHHQSRSNRAYSPTSQRHSP